MKPKVIFGATFWLTVVALSGWLATSAELGTGWQRLFTYATKAPQRFHVSVDKSEALTVGEQVLSVNGPRWELVGRVEKINSDKATQNSQVVQIVMDPECDAVRTFDHFHVVDARGDINWAMKLILPKEKMTRITNELNRFRHENEQDIIELTQIAGQLFVNDAISVIDDNLATALKKHEAEWKAVLDKHRVSLKTKLIPVLKKELGPTVKKSLNPLLTKIGRELWDELPLWSVTWRSVADQIPYVRQQYMEKWWTDFLENKAIPIVSAHEAEIIKLAETLAFEGAENPKVRSTMATVARELVNDPAFRKLSSAILNETLVEPFNAELFFKKLSNNVEFRQKFDLLTARFGPVAERIAKMLVENEKGPGVSPELVEVIRRLFFEKNRRALLLIRRDNGPIALSDSIIASKKLAAKKPVWQSQGNPQKTAPKTQATPKNNANAPVKQPAKTNLNKTNPDKSSANKTANKAPVQAQSPQTKTDKKQSNDLQKSVNKTGKTQSGDF